MCHERWALHVVIKRKGLPRCMECRRGLAMKILSVRLSDVKNDWRGRPLLPEILGQSDRVGAKSQIFDLFSSVAPQP